MAYCFPAAPSAMMYRVFMSVGLGLWLSLLAGCPEVDAPDLEPVPVPVPDAKRDAFPGTGSIFSPEDLKDFRLPESDEFGAIPQDPGNPLTAERVALGRLLFHDSHLLTRPARGEGVLSASCASCHHAAAGFQAGVRQSIGEGGEGFGEARVLAPGYDAGTTDVQQIRAPSTLHGAWSSNLLWNGQFGAGGVNVGTEDRWTVGRPPEVNLLGFEGLESQAIAGQDVHRLNVEASAIALEPRYRELFAAAFPNEDAPIHTINAGLAIAAYERTLIANQAPFQRWLRGEARALTDQEFWGMELFFGKADCVVCHHNPGLGAMEFHAIGMGDMLGPDVVGSDPEASEHLGRGGFTGREEDLYAFKVPQLYNLRDAPFYGHGGTLRSLRDVVLYKNRAIPENPRVPQAQLSPHFRPLELTTPEVDALVAFLETGLYDPALSRYAPGADELPGRVCAPNNDAVSRVELGCDTTLDMGFDLSGFALENHEHNSSRQRSVFPPGTIVPRNGVLVVARSATRAEFEAQWGPIDERAAFISMGADTEGAPIINGEERFALVNSEGLIIDGPSTPMQVGHCQVRRATGEGEQGPQWTYLPSSAAAPGSSRLIVPGAGVFISEIADLEGPGNWRFEFVEIAYFP